MKPLFSSREEFRSHMRAQGRMPSSEEAKQYLEDQGMDRGGVVRNQKAYELLDRHYHSFCWGVSGGTAQMYSYPTVNGLSPSLADLVKNALLLEAGQPPLFTVDPLTTKSMVRLKKLLASGSAGKLLARWIDAHCVLPERDVVPAIVEWLARAAAGEPSHVMTVVCPDYAVDAQGRYTFQQLNGGIGLVAQRALQLLPEFWQMLRECGIDTRMIVAIGDDEADDERIRAGVSETRESFRAKMRASQQALAQQFPKHIPVETPFMTEMNPALWQESLRKANELAQSRFFYGPLRISGRKRRQHMESRASLYRRWYGLRADVPQLFAHQAASYMASGQLVASTSNCLYIGCDSPAMTMCMHGLSESPLPVLSTHGAQY